MNRLIMIVGIPGSGKSTYIRNNKAETDVVISRDAIRFELVREDEEYFSRENEVFNSFLNKIEFALQLDKTVWADATHLNKKSRARVLNEVAQYADEVEAVFIDVPLEVAIERNDLREGRARVPHGVIRRMFYQMEPPIAEEGFTKITIIREDKDGKI